MGADVNGHIHPDRNRLLSMLKPQLPQEPAMFRKSNLIAAALVFAANASTMTATHASPLSIGLTLASSLVESVRLCPAGTHPGYEGKYCWRNHEGDACPPGFHLGYEGKYCWRNH
jgi:hypothetical protein